MNSEARFDNFFSHPSSPTRSLVVDQAVKIEHFVNSIIATLLGIEKRSSKSFGNTSSALSFFAKINLLLDLKILDPSHKLKIVTFSEIRNQFVHNLEVSEISECPEDLKKKLFRFYGKKSVSPDYPAFYDCLYKDVLFSVQDLYKEIGVRAGIKGEIEAKSQLMTLVETELKNYAKSDDSFSKKYWEQYYKAVDKFSKSITPLVSDIKNSPLI